MSNTINSVTLGQENAVYYVSFEQWKYISGRIRAAVRAGNSIGKVTITSADWAANFPDNPISADITVSRLCDFHIKQVVVSTINNETVSQTQNPVNAKAVKDYVAESTNFNFVTSNNVMLFNNGTTSINSFCSPEGRLTFTQDEAGKIKIEVVSPKVETLV